MRTAGRRNREGCDLFERLHAVRLHRIPAQDACRALLDPFDRQGFLAASPAGASPAPDGMDDAALLAELGVEAAAPDIAALRHVRPAAEKRAAAEIANRRQCGDFGVFRPLFEQVRREIDTGVRWTRPFETKADVQPGRFFIVGGQKACVAEMGGEFTQDYDYRDERLRVVSDNGAENNVLRHSLQLSLHKDAADRRINGPAAGLLFADRHAEGDEARGTVYGLRSKTSMPFIAASREFVNKIGVATGKVEARIARTQLDPIFLMADIEIVPTYRLSQQYRLRQAGEAGPPDFCTARLDIEIKDRFGNPVVPREWPEVPPRCHRRGNGEDHGRDDHGLRLRPHLSPPRPQVVMTAPFTMRGFAPKTPPAGARRWSSFVGHTLASITDPTKRGHQPGKT